MIGIYLSGTGNTKYCIEKLTKLLDISASSLPLESEKVVGAIQTNDIIILGYPTQFSNMPYMVRNFINTNASLWHGKKYYVLQQWELLVVMELVVLQDY